MLPRLLCVSSLALGACAPLASFRPASGLAPESHFELGAGAAVVGPRKYVDEGPAAADQIWITGEPTRWLSLSGITAFDATAAGVGGAVRIYPLRRERFALGVDGEVGYGWVAASLPMAVRPVLPVWIYTAPRIGNWGVDPVFGVIGGVDVNVQDGVYLRYEMQSSWQSFKYYNQRTHYGLAMAYQW